MITYSADAFQNGNFLTGKAVIADDTVIKIPFSDNHGLLIGGGNGFQEYFIVSFRADGPNGGMQSINSGTDVSIQGKTVLEGTTGPDGKVNLSCINGRIFIENRRGSALTFKWNIFG
ncbi:hypothetical protein [Bacillus cereus]|uniref:hypothetical protein n=1 Tax=Bacillus cereus TaxID=1396 RepID=UPI00027AB813|nr:hypothetical protein [Bacillus cereus]EJS63488.1 hypothetical protein ICY_05325 [Bacillus cereus BAG2X1-3]